VEVIVSVEIEPIGVQLLRSGRACLSRFQEVEEAMWLARKMQATLYHHGPLRRELTLCHMSSGLPHRPIHPTLDSLCILPRATQALGGFIYQSLRLFIGSRCLREQPSTSTRLHRRLLVYHRSVLNPSFGNEVKTRF
jgi:hypothetical protein